MLISTSMFKIGERIPLGQQDGWLFREGNETSWAGVDLDLSGWQKLKPTELTSKYADKTGKVEGWFRFRFELDSSFKNLSLGIRRGGWAATDIYIDGIFFKSFGNTGAYGGVYEEYNPIDKLAQPLVLDQHTEHLIALHFVDYTSAFPPWHLKSNTSGGTRRETTTPSYLLILTGPKHNTWVMNDSKATLKARTTWLSVTALLAGLFWLLAFQNLQERKNLLLIAICASFSALSNVCRFYFTDPEASFLTFRISWLLYNLSFWLFEVMVFLIVARILRFKFSKKLNLFLISVSFLASLLIFFDFIERFVYSVPIVIFFIFLYMLSSSWKKLRGAQWAILVGLLLTVLWGCVLVLQTFNISLGYRGFFVVSCFYFSFPISLLIYLSLRFREIIREVREHARLVVQMTEEKKEQAVKQQKVLEEEVARQTVEIRNSLETLKATQSQLIQQEKMASLGELTAGIAHEIQNPLNFVNNFSEVNKELIGEMKTEMEKGNLDDVKAIVADIENNEEKISHHGKRADAIVKGMLQHSRASTGKKELTDINALADEYLRLAYHVRWKF